MLRRHRLTWAALREFIVANEVSSLIEVGCGAAYLAADVDRYTGIDVNQNVLEDNKRRYGDTPKWMCEDWHQIDVGTMDADLLLSMALIEHCESYEAFLEQVFRVRALKFAIITFHKGLGDVSEAHRKAWNRESRSGHWCDNYYCQSDVAAWLDAHLRNAVWKIYTIQHTHHQRPNERLWWDSVLCIDWTRNGNWTMWEAANGTG
jgi:SAM-dependent methyltransferase